MLEVVDCVDWEKSEIAMDDRFPIVRKIDKLVLREASVPLFRPKGLQFLLCCNDAFVEHVAASKCSGLGSWRLDEYTFPPPFPNPHDYDS